MSPVFRSIRNPPCLSPGNDATIMPIPLLTPRLLSWVVRCLIMFSSQVIQPLLLSIAVFYCCLQHPWHTNIICCILPVLLSLSSTIIVCILPLLPSLLLVTCSSHNCGHIRQWWQGTMLWLLSTSFRRQQCHHCRSPSKESYHCHCGVGLCIPHPWASTGRSRFLRTSFVSQTRTVHQ